MLLAAFGVHVGGTALVRCDDQEYELTAGGTVFLPKQIPHGTAPASRKIDSAGPAYDCTDQEGSGSWPASRWPRSAESRTASKP
ncbi:AraC family ligand binding domain-containing protein [Kitasatospora sp. NBC_01302]|uniref:AraC family ligand binding domain-containing protein n=1 Tax=Kitasatospora sp. NBC_01302 TaxID=2903575 RepID=UPI002E11F599|nr:AraC family ligand binding domain-containing protein [Kitasatospora sp. NBC_01302]